MGNNIRHTQEFVKTKFSEQGLIVKDIYKNCGTALYCIDNDGYEYMQRLGDLLNGKKCCKVHRQNPYSINNIKRYLKETNSTLTLLENKYINSSTKMTFKCECGTEFLVSWNNILKGRKYCNFCSKSKRFDNLRDYTKEIKEHCESKNYTLVTSYIHRSHDKFEYVCNEHKDKGIQYSTYDSMINSHYGCKFCASELIGVKHRLDESLYKEAVEKAGFIYVSCDYNNKDNKYKKANIHYICPNHIDKGIQTIQYSNLLRSNGKCGYCIGRNRTKEDLQKEIDNLHNTIEILEYKDYASKILCKCKICNHEWESKGDSLTQGCRCPSCSKSNFEISVSKILDKLGYNYQSEYWFKNCRDILPLPFDFYLNDYNVLIEADGEHHYIPIKRGSMNEEKALISLDKIKFHDSIKTKYCKENSIPLIRIPYWERDNLEYFLYKEFTKIGLLNEKVV